jgi:hypothetical protein
MQNIAVQSPLVAARQYIAWAFLQSAALKAKSFASTPAHWGDNFSVKLVENPGSAKQG